MECIISIDNKKVKEYLGDISNEAFAELCKDAVVSRIFASQFEPKNIQLTYSVLPK